MKIVPPALAAIMLMLALGSQASAQEIRWLKSATQAAQLANETGKPILVYVRSASCHYCDKLQRDVWEDRTSALSIGRNFIPLKLTREDNAAELEALQIRGYPATFVFSPERKFVHRVDGYLERPKFMAELEEARRLLSTEATTRVGMLGR